MHSHKGDKEKKSIVGERKWKVEDRKRKVMGKDKAKDDHATTSFASIAFIWLSFQSPHLGCYMSATSASSLSLPCVTLNNDSGNQLDCLSSNTCTKQSKPAIEYLKTVCTSIYIFTILKFNINDLYQITKTGFWFIRNDNKI